MNLAQKISTPKELFYIPLSEWVQRTIEKMNRSDKKDSDTWDKCWVETYRELGGQSEESGSKGCPKHAAFGLWRLGYVIGSNVPYHPRSLTSIKQEYGKNTAYAAIAVDLLERGQAASTDEQLWQQVRGIYQQALRDKPAASNQGAVKVAQILFDEGHLVKSHG